METAWCFLQKMSICSRKFLGLGYFLRLLFTLFVDFLWTSHQSEERGLRKNVISPRCIPQPETQSSSIFTLSFKTISSSGLIPAYFCLQTQTEGITQIKAVPNQGFPNNLNSFVLENTKNIQLTLIYFGGLLERKINEHRKKGWSSEFFAHFRSIQAPKKFECLAGTWLLISPEPPNTLRFLIFFFLSVLIIKNCFVVMEKCPKEPKRRQAAFWGGE